MCISVIYSTLSMSCKSVVSMLSPLVSNSCGGSQFVIYVEIKFEHVHGKNNEEHDRNL